MQRLHTLPTGWRRLATILPPLMAAIASCVAVPLARAASCTGCSGWQLQSANECVQTAGTCDGGVGSNPYYQYLVSWSYSQCTNGYKITGCSVANNGCCGTLLNVTCTNGDNCN